MNLNAIKDGIAATLKPVTGLTVYKADPATLRLPAVVIKPGDDFITYRSAMGASTCEIQLQLIVVVSRSDEAKAVAALDGYLSSGTGLERSLIDALDADPTLGGTVDSSAVLEAKGNLGYGDGSATHAAASVSLSILASRK